MTAWRTAANVADAFDFSIDLEMQQALIFLWPIWPWCSSASPRKKRDKMPKPLGAGLILFILGYNFAFSVLELSRPWGSTPSSG